MNYSMNPGQEEIIAFLTFFTVDSDFASRVAISLIVCPFLILRTIPGFSFRSSSGVLPVPLGRPSWPPDSLYRLRPESNRSLICSLSIRATSERRGIRIEATSCPLCPLRTLRTLRHRPMAVDKTIDPDVITIILSKRKKRTI